MQAAQFTVIQLDCHVVIVHISSFVEKLHLRLAGYASETRSHQWHPSLSRDAMCCRDLILRLFQRYRASKELHFKIVQDMDSDKEEKNAVVKVAFMNSAVSEPINPMTALTNETAHSRVFSSCNERILDSLSTCKISCQAAEQ
ncbi:hypothetical protein QR680_002884 [Steinernema hermaphroditum]|uniref:Uncharacterized protein n=1 Tax=Steinernema hermaphroditum TaxID=289476 RepID=A0AA39LJ18_9BILA|nr:hypothetical protein QR680_002884 [Steinernema hermaphroditum]